MLERERIVNVYHQQMNRIPVGRPLEEDNISEISYPRIE